MTPRDRRAVTLGLALVGLGVLALRVVPYGATQVQALRDRVMDDAATLATARRQVAGAAGLEDSARLLRKRLDGLASALLSGRDGAEAWIDLSGRIGRAASRHGVTLIQAAPQPDTGKVGLLRRLTATAQIQSDLRGILAMVAELERDTVVLLVSELRISAADPRALATVPEILQAELYLRSWFLPRASDRASSP